MAEARALIAALLDIDRTADRGITKFIPSLVGLFGTVTMFDQFLTELDAALTTQNIAPPLKERSVNLVKTFIPQVASYNGIEKLSLQSVTPDQLRALRADTLDGRDKGLRVILAALLMILDEVVKLD